MSCKTDITKEQSSELLQTIYIMVSTNIPPYTIVDYVCAAIDIPSVGIPSPEISATNWCLLTCVSSCLYKNTLFTVPSTYTYINKPLTYTCLTSCFPVFPESSSGGGGGAPPPSNSLAEWKAQQEANVLNELEKALEWLEDILKRAFENLGITCASFAFWIAMLAEHCSEITAANISKRIGAAIDWIAKALKSAADWASSVAARAKAAIASLTDGNTTGPVIHLHPTSKQLLAHVQSGMAHVRTVLTDIMKNAGQYIEQAGDFVKDLADRVWDLKEIAFAAASLGSMVSQIVDLIDWTTGRIDETTEAATNVISNLNEKYSDQISNKIKEAVNNENFNGLIENTINNKSLPNKETLIAAAQNSISSNETRGVIT